MCEQKRSVLCGANGYEEKYYFNKEFAGIPQSIQDELHILCVLFTEEVGGIFTIVFDEEGNILLETQSGENDYYYDEINSGLMVREVQKNRQEMFEALRMYYRVFVLKEETAEVE